MQVVYNGYIKLPAEFDLDSDRLPSAFTYGSCSERSFFPTPHAPFQYRSNFKYRNGRVVVPAILQSWTDGTSSNGSNLCSQKWRYVDEGYLLGPKGYFAVVPGSLTMAPEKEVIANKWFDTKRDEFAAVQIAAMADIVFTTNSGQEFYIEPIFAALAGDGSYLAAAIGLTRGNASHSKKCVFCSAAFGKSFPFFRIHLNNNRFVK
jgi:hypothetical protein